MHPTQREAAIKRLGDVWNLVQSATCRHRALVEYFGQSWSKESCEACDVCLGELECVSEGTLSAQKLLSCVVRVKQRFAAKHLCDVLRGTSTAPRTRHRHPGPHKGLHIAIQRARRYPQVTRQILCPVHPAVAQPVYYGDQPVLAVRRWQYLRRFGHGAEFIN